MKRFLISSILLCLFVATLASFPYEEHYDYDFNDEDMNTQWFFSNVWHDVKKAAHNVEHAAKNVVNNVENTAKNVENAAKNVMNKVENTAKKVAGGVERTISKASSNVHLKH